MKQLMNWIAGWGEKDKWIHASICLLAAMTAAVIAKLFGADKYQIVAAAWFTGFFAGVFKEIWDDWRASGSDSADWAADIIGTTIATIYTFYLLIL